MFKVEKSLKYHKFVMVMINNISNRTSCRPICNGNRTEWRPIRSVIIRVINKIGRPRNGSPIFV